MSNFNVIEIVNANTIKVEPSWKLTLKNGREVMGDEIIIRGLDSDGIDAALIKSRLEKILIKTDNEIDFKSPELISYEDDKNAIVSCSVYLAKTNILYYFPEYVHIA